MNTRAQKRLLTAAERVGVVKSKHIGEWSEAKRQIEMLPLPLWARTIWFTHTMANAAVGEQDRGTVDFWYSGWRRARMMDAVEDFTKERGVVVGRRRRWRDRISARKLRIKAGRVFVYTGMLRDGQ